MYHYVIRSVRTHKRYDKPAIVVHQFGKAVAEMTDKVCRKNMSDFIKPELNSS